jgi:hypothetical protein
MVKFWNILQAIPLISCCFLFWYHERKCCLGLGAQGQAKKDSQKSTFFPQRWNQRLTAPLLGYPDDDRIDPTCAPPTHHPDLTHGPLPVSKNSQCAALALAVLLCPVCS